MSPSFFRPKIKPSLLVTFLNTKTCMFPFEYNNVSICIYIYIHGLRLNCSIYPLHNIHPSIVKCMGSSEVIQLNTEHKIFLQLNHCIVANNNIIKSHGRDAYIPPTPFHPKTRIVFWMIFRNASGDKIETYFIDILLIIFHWGTLVFYLKICLSWGWHNLNNDNVLIMNGWLPIEWPNDLFDCALAIMKMNVLCGCLSKLKRRLAVDWNITFKIGY